MNRNHTPAGSPNGGQFTTGSTGGESGRPKLSHNQRGAIEDYSGDQFQAINGGLRNDTLSKGQRETVRQLDAALDKLPDHSGDVYRSIRVTPEINEQIKSGTLKDAAYASSTQSPGITHRNPTKDQVTLKIIGGGGKDIAAISNNPGEKEVLFARGSEFEVLRTKDVQSGGRYLLVRVKGRGKGLTMAQYSGLWLGPEVNAAAAAQAEDGLTFWKDILTLGQYTDPKDGRHFAITPELYGEIEASHAAMAAIGDEPPLLFDHHDGAKEMARNTAGYVKALRRQGDKLQAKVRFADDESRRIGLRNKVSVRVIPDVQLSNGERHKLALTHVALTPRPVLTHNMDDWSLALSRDGEGVALEPYFAAPTPTKESDMTPEQLVQIKELDPTATEDNGVAVLLAYAKQEKKNGEKSELELSQVKTELADTKKLIPLQLSQAEAAFGERAIDGQIESVTREWPQAARNAAVAYAKDKKRSGLMLSKDGDRLGLDDFADFCRALPLKGLTATNGQEQTPPQSLTLARAVPGADTSTGDALAEGKSLAGQYQTAALKARGL